jgi:hypothetical protein
MCNFHSTCWRMLGEKVEFIHKGHNSHSQMIEECGWRPNQPNHKIVIFEAEWDGESDIPSISKLLRNSEEALEKLTDAVLRHYTRLKDALETGNLEHFQDTKKYWDVWNAVIAKGHAVALPAVFHGNLAVSGSAKLDAPLLASVNGKPYKS